MAYLSSVLFFLIPLLFLGFFVTSLIMYLVAVSKNKKTPDTYSKTQVKTLKVLLIVSSVILGVLLAVIISLIALLYMAVAYM